MLTLSAAGANDAVTPHLLSGALSEAELRGILKAVGGSPPPIAIHAIGSQTLPFFRHATVFLKATVPASASGVVRGTVVYLKCFTKPGTECKAEWQTAEMPSRYVQLPTTPGVPAGESVSPTTPPFVLDGELSDEDLISLVAYVRTSPRPPAPPGRTAMGLRGDWTIIQVSKNADGTVHVLLEDNGNGVSDGHFKRLPRGWLLTKASMGVY